MLENPLGKQQSAFKEVSKTTSGVENAAALLKNKIIQLLILDYDGTLAPSTHAHLSHLLEVVVEEQAGTKGLDLIEKCREENGAGENALKILKIPFWKVGEKIIERPPPITENLELVQLITELKCKKVVFSASPTEAVVLGLRKLGFNNPEKVFQKIIGWKKEDKIPAKWTNPIEILRSILVETGCEAQNTYLVGDSVEKDVQPAKTVKINSVIVGERSPLADLSFERLIDFVQIIKSLES